ncbi:hypothetical protein MLD38_030036 [Melastoma candidum]|uniref:Uncharacterized protein n=1 Tax=Melastoma candidum TaxID=119954 RepID=A0ACB9MLY7_9MYRT|nr:hypothetical protein MLD38_030036 [Melastoma candidum]
MACPPRIMAVAVAVSMAMCLVRAAPDVSVEDVGCTDDTYDPRDSMMYYPGVEHVLDDMATVTANHPGYNFYTSAPYPLSDIIVHANCNVTLSVRDCITCLSTAKTIMTTKCADKLAARMQLKDCYMVYGPIGNITSKRTW